MGCLAGRGWAVLYCSWLAEGGRVEGGVRGCRLMFHLLFVPRYLDYVQTDLGGYLNLSLSCLEELFHFAVCRLRPHFLSLLQTHTNCFLSVILTLLSHPVTSSHGPKSLFSFFSSIHPPFLLSFLNSSFLCSAATLSSLLHVFCRLTVCWTQSVPVILYIQVLCDSETIPVCRPL